MSDDYKFQASMKFGDYDSAMLNIRAQTPEELENAIAAVEDLSGRLVVAAQMLRAESVVSGRFPGTTVVGTEGASAANPNGYTQPAQRPAQPAPPDYTRCPHGPRMRRTGGSGNDYWEGYFCCLDKSHPERCKPVYPAKR